MHSYSKGIVLPGWRVVDIDNNDDWLRAENILKRIKMKFSFGIIGCGNIAGNYKINNKKFLKNFTHSSSFIKYFYPLICIDKDIKKAKKFKKMEL